ncbi:terminase large subunit [Shewanella phage FishSpeaker]|nr:terminase large subunit [Shewanella phage FishSpeaker]
MGYKRRRLFLFFGLTKGGQRMKNFVTISRAHNYLRLFDYNQEFVAKVIMPFCRLHLYKYVQEPDPITGDPVWKVDNVFARFNNDKTEFRISSGFLSTLVDFMVKHNYPDEGINFITEPEIVPVPAKFKFKKGWGEPRENQIDYIAYQNAPGALKVNNASMGAGKAQSLTSLLKIPNGWKKMGDIKVGDTVIAKDGSHTKVTGVFPQGVTELYRVTMDDGRVTECNPEHLWDVYNWGILQSSKNPGDYEKRWETITTRDIVNKMNTRKNYKAYIPLCEPEDSPDHPFIIHPYVMGVLLGDGGLSCGQPTVTKPYQQIFDNIEKLLPDHLKCQWINDSERGKQFTFSIIRKERGQGVILKELLEGEGVWGKRSWEKGIPVDYLLKASKQQRLDLLNGLLDTDGCISDKGTPSFSSSSKQLSLGVQYLVRSLGGIAKLTTRTPHYTYKGEKKSGRTDYRVFIRYPRPEELFTLTHKKERCRVTQYSKTLKLGIKSIEKIENAKTQCIMIDHPSHLYVTDDFIVTHNTFMAMSTIIHHQVRTLVIVQPKYIPVWIKAFGEQLDFGLEDILILDNGNIEELHTSFLNKVIDPGIVVIPMTRIQMYLKKMKEDSSLPSLDKIFSDFGFGLRLYDEAHEAFHQIYTSMLFGNVAKTLMLSATMKSDDKFTNNMYNIVIPPDIYLKATEHKQYIETYAYHYRIDQRRFFIGHKSMGNYSDVMFEKNMMRNKITQKFYLDMMYKSFEEYYLSRRKEGTKCIIFFTKTDTVERFKNYLLKKHPDLDVIDFTGLITKKKEMKNEYLKHEVVITTPGSCGTGKDIPGLITVLCSHNVSSIQRNDQIIGRLRPTEGKFDPYLPPIFVYFVCDDIPKHREYHDKRKTLFHSKSVLQKNIDSHCHLN